MWTLGQDLVLWYWTLCIIFPFQLTTLYGEGMSYNIYYIKGILQNAGVVHAAIPVLFFALFTAFNSVVFEYF